MAGGRAVLRHLLLGCLLIGAAALTWVIVRQDSSSTSPPRPPADAPAPSTDLALARIDYTETRDGRPVWRLQAENAEHDRASDVTRARQVQMVFFDRQQRPLYRLRADAGKMEAQGRQVEVWGGVKVELSEGRQLRTERLRLDSRKNRVSTEAPVQLEARNWTVTGRGLDYELDSGRLTVRSEVKARLQVPAHAGGNS